MFHGYPYTDFHEANLDWFLAKFKSLLAEWVAMGQRFDTLEDEVKALREWFENLDVSDEINAKLEEMAQDGTLKALLTFQRGSKISLHRTALLTTFDCRSTTKTEPETTDYSMVQSFTTDGTYMYLMGYAAGFLDEDNIKIMKYSGDLSSKIAENVITCSHANGSAYHDGKLYITNSDMTINVVDAGTLNIINVIDLSDKVDIALINICVVPVDNVDHFYIGNADKWYVFDQNFNVVAVKYLDYTAPIPNATGNICYHDGLIYRTGWPNTLFSFTIDGEIVNVYNIGTKQYDYLVNELEAVVSYNGKLLLTASSWCGYPTGTMITQFFEADPKHGIYEFYKDDQYIYSTRTIYVNANYAGGISDGTQARPYKSLTWALSETKCFNNIHRAINVEVLSDIPEFVEISGMQNCLINFNNHSIYGMRVWRCDNIRLRNGMKINANSSFDYSTNFGYLFYSSDSGNINVITATLTGLNDNNLKALYLQFTNGFKCQDLVITGISQPCLFEESVCELGYINSSIKNPFAELAFSTKVDNFNNDLIFFKSSTSTYVNRCRLYHNTNNTAVSVGALSLESDIANILQHYHYLLVCINVPTLGSQTFRWDYYRGTFDIVGGYYDSGFHNFALRLTKTNNSISVTDVQNDGAKNIVITDIYGTDY